MAKRALLVPGLQVKKFVASSRWEKLLRILKKKGWEIYVSNYGNGQPMKKSLVHYAAFVAEEIKRIHPDVIFAHSMGGLIVRYAIEKLGCGFSGLKVFLMESPHQGLPDEGVSFGRMLTKVVAFFKKLEGFNWDMEDWESWNDMKKGSGFLKGLNRDYDPKTRIGVCYYQIGGALNWLFPETFDLPRSVREGLPSEIEIKYHSLTHREIFPTVGHSGLKKNDKVISYMMGIIDGSWNY